MFGFICYNIEDEKFQYYTNLVDKIFTQAVAACLPWYVANIFFISPMAFPGFSP